MEAAQENIPVGVVSRDPAYRDKLVSLQRLLMRYGNPKSTALGQADDQTLLFEYENVFGPVAVAPLRLQPQRNAYRMMAELAHADDIRAWLEEWRHRGLDLGPFKAPHGFFAAAPLGAPAPLGAVNVGAMHDALDERMPNGTIRHLHDTAVAGNRGRPIILSNGLVDPYRGTGLDPTRLSGVVAPFRSTLEPYMACCGQALGPKGEIPPGCWMTIAPPGAAPQAPGTLVPYQVWFQRDGLDPETIWQNVVAGTASALFVNSIQTGTAFVDRAYYRELDRQIRALVAIVAPAVIQAQLAAFQAGFPAGASVARSLPPAVREQLIELVELVDQYNAPQMGADWKGTLCNDDYMDHHVALLTAGRVAFAEGRLQQNVVVDGVALSVLRDIRTLPALIAQWNALPNKSARINDVLAYLDRIQQTQNTVTRMLPWLNQRVDVTKRIATAWTTVTNGGTIAIPNLLHNSQLRPVVAAMTNIFNHNQGFPALYNRWLQNPDTTDLRPFIATLGDLMDALDVVLAPLPMTAELTTFLTALEAPSEADKDAFIANPTNRLVGHGNLPSVRHYAQFALALPGMRTALPAIQTKLNQAATTLQNQALADIQQQQQQQQQQAASRAVAAQLKRIIGDRYIKGPLTRAQQVDQMTRAIGADVAKWEKIQTAFAALAQDEFLTLWTADVPGRFFNQYIDRIDQTPTVQAQRAWEEEYMDDLAAVQAQLEERARNQGQWQFGNPIPVPPELTARLAAQASPSPDETLWARGFLFQTASCAYDSVFPALFKIPGQWLQYAIRNARSVIPLKNGCDAAGALQLHEQMGAEITYMEGRQAGSIRTCVNINQAWNRCIPTKEMGSLLEDDPRIMTEGLIHFYGLERHFVRVPYGQNIHYDADTELILVYSAGQNGPFPHITTQMGPTEFTLIACVAHIGTDKGGHWRSYVRHPKTQQWWMFDPYNLKTADAEPMGPAPPAVRVTTNGFVPQGWFYVRTNRLSAAPLSANPPQPRPQVGASPLQVRVISITCPTSAQADCGTLVLAELFKRNGRPEVTYFDIRNKFREWFDAFGSGIPFDDNTQIPNDLFQRALVHFMPDRETTQWFLTYKPGQVREVRYDVLNPGKQKATTQLILMSAWQRATATQQAGPGAGHYALLETNRPARPDEIAASMVAQDPPQEPLAVPSPVPSGGSGTGGAGGGPTQEELAIAVAEDEYAVFEENREKWFNQRSPDQDNNLIIKHIKDTIEQLRTRAVMLFSRQNDAMSDAEVSALVNKRPAGNRYFDLTDDPSLEYGLVGFMTSILTLETAIFDVNPQLMQRPKDDRDVGYPLQAYRTALFPLLRLSGLMPGDDWTRASFADFDVRASKTKWNKTTRFDVAYILILLTDVFLSMLEPIVDEDGNFLQVDFQQQVDVFEANFATLWKELNGRA